MYLSRSSIILALFVFKGKATLEAAGGAGAAMGSPGRSMTGMGTTAMRGMGDAFGGGQGSGMSKDQQQVLDAICSYHDEQGISIQQLKQKLRNLSEQQMRYDLTIPFHFISPLGIFFQVQVRG